MMLKFTVTVIVLYVFSLAVGYMSFFIFRSPDATIYIGDVLFVFCISTYILRSEYGMIETSVYSIVSTLVLVIVCVVSLFSGGVIYQRIPVVGSVLVQSFNIGYYPPGGPDMPFEIGAPVWVLSIATLIATGVVIGLVLRKALRQGAD